MRLRNGTVTDYSPAKQAVGESSSEVSTIQNCSKIYLKNVDADGKCFYACINDECPNFLDTGDAQQKICTWVLNNWKMVVEEVAGVTLGNLVGDIHFGNNDDDVTKLLYRNIYCKKSDQMEPWGGTPEMVAVSRITDRPVVVYEAVTYNQNSKRQRARRYRTGDGYKLGKKSSLEPIQVIGSLNAHSHPIRLCYNSSKNNEHFMVIKFT
jgi:hypothetical protein